MARSKGLRKSLITAGRIIDLDTGDFVEPSVTVESAPLLAEDSRY